MHVSVKWFNQNFNVNFAKTEGGEDFLSIKGCRIASGSNGDFVSYPSQKKQNGDGYWNHVWASQAFNDHVLKLAKEAMPQQAPQQSRQAAAPASEDIPFAKRADY
jgi:hypothetical protein